MKKSFKYLITAILAITVVMSFSACGTRVDKHRIGVYNIESQEVFGQIVDGDGLKLAGLEGGRLELKKKGKGTLSLGGQTIDITWNNETIKEDDQVLPYTINGDLLTIEINDGKLNFKKQ